MTDDGRTDVERVDDCTNRVRIENCESSVFRFGVRCDLRE